MRIGELLDTRLSDVDLNEQKIEIMEAQKTRVGRVVYLSEDACAGTAAVAGTSIPEKRVISFTAWAGRGLSYEAVRGRFERYLIPGGSGATAATACTACGTPLPVNCSTPGCAWSACSSSWGTAASR